MRKRIITLMAVCLVTTSFFQAVNAGTENENQSSATEEESTAISTESRDSYDVTSQAEESNNASASGSRNYIYYYDENGNKVYNRIKPLTKIYKKEGEGATSPICTVTETISTSVEATTQLSDSSNFYHLMENDKGYFISPKEKEYNMNDIIVELDLPDYAEMVGINDAAKEAMIPPGMETSFSRQSSMRSNPEAIIIIPGNNIHQFLRFDMQKAYFEKLARIHTLCGLETQVVTFEDIYEAGELDIYSENSSNKILAIRNYIIECYESSNGHMKHVVIGGRTDEVPALKVRADFDFGFDNLDILNLDKIDNEFRSDLYYADFSNWKLTSYSEVNIDQKEVMEQMHEADEYNNVALSDYEYMKADISVSRLPIGEIKYKDDDGDIHMAYGKYIDKVIHHMTNYDMSNRKKTLLLSNNATNLIDSAWWLEHYTIDFIPNAFDVKKLYQSNNESNWEYTLNRAETELSGDYNLIVYMGHGSEANLLADKDEDTKSFSGERAFKMENDHYPIMISGGCFSCNLNYSTPAGVDILFAPKGGVIAFIGNSTYGSSFYGNCQFIDTFIDRIGTKYSNNKNPILSDVFKWALNNGINESDNWVDENSEKATKLSVILMGDGLIPVYTNYREDAPNMSIFSRERKEITPENYGCEITVGFYGAGYSDGVFMLHTENGNYYRIASNGDNKCTFSITENPDAISVGYYSSECLSFYKEYYFYTDESITYNLPVQELDIIPESDKIVNPSLTNNINPDDVDNWTDVDSWTSR
jgi:peptidase C25-like protein